MTRVKAFWFAFLAWWLAELKACLPLRLRHILFRPRDRITFERKGDGVLVQYISNGNSRDLGAVLVADRPVEAIAADIDQRLMTLAAGGRDMLLRIAGGAVLRRLVEMPAATEENLREVMTFDMERQTPFTAEQVYFDARVVRRLPERHRIAVELIVVPRTFADPTLAALQSWGVAINGIDVAKTGDEPRVIPLASQSATLPASRRLRLATGALAGVAAVLLIGVIVLPLRRQQAELEGLTAQVASARKAADGARKTQDAIDHLSALDRFLFERKTARPPKVALLDELSRIVPDDTWLYRVRFSGDEVQTFGYSAAPSNLIGPFEASPFFKDPQFMAPLMRDPRVDAERFTISLQTEKGPPQ